MRNFMIGLAPALLAVSSPALAAEQDWRVSEVTGDVQVTSGGQTRKASRGTLLSTGAVIATGADAKAVIVRGEEFVVISPRTQLRLPAAERPNAIMQLIEDFGTALFQIKKKATPHFGVQTPYLAAVVKGTTFTVTVGPQGSSVQVIEGLVQVETLDGGAAELVRPSEIAVVDAHDLYQLSVSGQNDRVIRSNLAPVQGAVTTQVAPAAVSAPYAGPLAQPIRITHPVNENVQRLSDITDGLLEGTSSVDLALAEVKEQLRAVGRGTAEPVRNDGDKPAEKEKPDDKDKPADKDKPVDKDEPDKDKSDDKDKRDGKDKPNKDKSDDKDKRDGKDKPDKDKSDDKDKRDGKDKPDKDKSDDKDSSDGKNKPDDKDKSDEKDKPGKGKPE